MSRPPRKYLDQQRTLVSEEWLAWKKQRDEDDEAWLRHGWLMAGGSDQVYFPEDYGKDLGEGAWIFVIDVPHTALRWEVPLLSMWWARPHHLNGGRVGPRLPYQGVIQTPGGDLHLWPHEYIVATDPKGLLGLEGVAMHSLGGQPVLDEDALFYLQSRGISASEATLLLFDQVAQPNFVYVTFPDYAVEMFAGVGTSIHSGVRAAYLKEKTRECVRA